MIQYLLDTNVVSDLLKNPAGRASQRMGLIDPSAICISVVVLAELRFGFAKKMSFRLMSRLESLLDELAVQAWAEPADRRYAEVRAALERAGTPIGANDLLIAAHALALDCILVTDNEREFSRVPGLRVENWLRPG
ncbi:MAG: type II toxin-antitoxin system VapC family toxin [Brevundimonas sp.]